MTPSRREARSSGKVTTTPLLYVTGRSASRVIRSMRGILARPEYHRSEVTPTNDLYGARSGDMNELRRAIEAVLNIEFEARWSDFLGGEYFSWRPSDATGREHLRVIFNHHRNLSDYEPAMEVAEPAFTDYLLLLRVEGSERGDELKRRLASVPELDFLRLE
jgi:hypothetical protein